MFIEAQGERGCFFNGTIFLLDKYDGPQRLFVEAQGK